MKFDFFRKKCDKTGSDCECGCTKEARDSVRLTDAEIAEDVLADLQDIADGYAYLCKEGCDCEDKFSSCQKSCQCLCDYIRK